VCAVAQVILVPFSGSESVNASSWADGEPPRRARQRLVTPGYFAAMGISMRAGRDFADADRADAGGVVVVDERFVERYLAGRDPLTATVRIASGTQGESRQARVIGVVHTIRHGSLDEQSELATMYELGIDPTQMSWYVLRSAQDPAALAQTVRAEVERRLPSARVAMLLPLGELVERSVRQRRAIARAVAVFGGATLLLAALGLYAALAFAFQRRRQELALRMALGATPRHIVALVLRQGLLLAALALPFGVLAGVLLALQQAPMLYRLQPGDPVTWSLAAASIVIATLLAALPSALGAARIAPQAALRTE
jgi:putative ABC transport system permease protein